MNSEQEFKCVFCSDIFEDKETLQIHFRKHADPNFKTAQKTENSTTQRCKDQVEMVECDVCPEVFTSISKAITHKHKFHPDHDAKYFCPWCGKLFTMKHLYNKHIRTNHPDLEKKDDKQFPCDSCNVDFNVPAAMLYHNKFFHRQDTDLPSIGTSKKLKIFNQEVVLIYYCPFCGEEYDNKVNLHKHIGDDHGDENQSPEDVLRCPLCDAVFYHLDAYELHLTHHSIEDMYSERNELADQITDFSLESVPPMAEKVENLEEELDGENDKIGIEKFLEFAMDETKEKKSKKHKKHKKSKKSAITLDEFFSMNKDVFGEEIDFQGVEEVPTQVVAKKLKVKKTPAGKFVSQDIEKLKKQGIMVRKKPGPKPVLKKETTKVKKNVKISNNSYSPDDVLQKLLNQSNSQIKIVRKPNINTVSPEENTEKVTDEKAVISSVKELQSNNSDLNEDNEKTEVNPQQDSIETQPQNEEVKEKRSEDVPPDNNQTSNTPVPENKSTDPLRFLKNNLNIVIKSNKPNIVQANEENKIVNKTIEKNVDEMDEEENHDMEQDDRNTDNKVNVLKHLSHLTVKSNQSKSVGLSKTENKNVDVRKISVEEKQITNINKPTNDPIPLPYYNENKQIDRQEETNECTTPVKVERRPESKISTVINNPNLSIQTVKKSPVTSQKESPKDNSKIDKTSNTNSSSFDLLKHLKNVTAKPINKNNSNVTISPINKIIKKEPKSPTRVEKKIEESIEIFSVDDSDTDEEYKGSKQTLQTTPENKTNCLNKNVTIKPVNQNIKGKIRVLPKIKQEPLFEDDQLNDNLDITSKQDNIHIKNQTQKVIPNVLKNLSKNITIKSRNPSPQNVKNQNQQLQDFDPSDDEMDDIDVHPSKVKITEIQNMSDEDIPENKNANLKPADNVTVQYPDDSDSDHDNDLDDHFSDEDIEEQLKTTQVMKAPPNNTVSHQNYNTLKKLSKDITIKSSNHTASESATNTPSDDIPSFAKSLSNQISIKNMRVNNRQDMPTNKDKTVNRQANQSINQKVMSNQVNTKEVKTVKTFQSQTQTVIEEITTTVTKTIKTVNQTVKQETRQESGQSSSIQTIQRVPNQIQKNYQGVKIRQATPLGPPRPRNLHPVRVPCQVRPVNEVAIRAPAPRLNKPRMAGPKCMKRPQILPQIQGGPVGKTVALANNTAIKRLSPEDTTAHFSCFKKPKESLIPGEDVQIPDNIEPSVQYSKSVQMNKSNYSCTTNAVKGDSIVTSTQIRSETSASSQHLSKLKNMSGLSVVKTSQVKQAHVVEKSEISASQKTTLDAIQRLQSQGLLVKKPRIDVSKDEIPDPVEDAGPDSNEEYYDE